ncbi:MAG: T9SS type A sorting domain-containing protein [Bacteroidia bacterium]|nr:T9SS type A sorting domain-containing protein [Bacteroidia bacterium]
MNIKDFSGNFSLKIFITVLLVMSSVDTLKAQWSSIPSSQLIISQTGSPYGARIEYANQNCYYITYYKGINRTYCLFLQILDANGYSLFAGDGIIISDHASQGKYETTTDHKGNLLVALRETTENETCNLSIYKVDQAGKKLWGESGINFKMDGTNEGPDQIVVNPDNSISMLLTRFDKAGVFEKCKSYIYRISENGTILWNSEPVIMQDTTYDLISHGMRSLPDGGVLAVYRLGSLYTSGGWKVKRLYSNGKDAWLKDVRISGSPGPGLDIQTYSGKDGNYYLSWYKYLQGITPEGTFLWPEPGICITTKASTNQDGASVKGIDTDGNIFIVWYEPAGGSMYTLYGQLIGHDGEMKWGGDGIEIKRNYNPGCCCSIQNDTAILVYHDQIFYTPIFQAVKANALKMDGTFCWPREVLINDLMSDHAIYGLSPIVNGQGVFVFGEEGGVATGRRILAQNIRMDGSIGLKTSGVLLTDPESEIHVYFRQEEGIIINGLDSTRDIVIYNTLGQIMHQVKALGIDVSIQKVNTNQWKPGIYFIKIFQKDNKITFSKVLIN